jgi:tetratricopeptide (TPR) repeat protein
MNMHYWTCGLDELPPVDSKQNAQKVWADFKGHLDAGHTLEALKRINRLLEFDPQYPLLWHWKSRLLFDLNDLEEASRAVTTLLELEPSNVESRYFDAFIKYQREDFESALQKCSELLLDRPDIALIWGLKAGILLQMHRLDESALTAQQALALDPESERALHILEKIRAIREQPDSEFIPAPPYEWGDDGPIPQHTKIIIENSLLKLPVYADLLRYGESRSNTPLVTIIDCADSPEYYEDNRSLFPGFVAAVTGYRMNVLKIPAIDLLYITLHPEMKLSADTDHLELFNMHFLEILAQLPNPRPERMAFIGDEEGARYATYLTCKFSQAKALAVTRGIGMLDSASLFNKNALVGKCCCVASDRSNEPPTEEFTTFVEYLEKNGLGKVVLTFNFTEHCSDEDRLLLFDRFTIESAFQHALAYACGIPDPANEGVFQ